ncbi:hypothetical protein ACRS3X_25410 [Ectopseudomonas hydrolytica]|uniref:hypothetical protein n=1 Tax=Ectopseudomonas hydrolytica TaxID=2493633 RepID=UPI003EE24FFE
MRIGLDELAAFFVSPPGALVAFALVVFVALGWPYSGSAADWASAAGTTAAVFAAIWLADRQHQIEERRQHRADYEATYGLLKMAVFCVTAAKQAAINLAEGRAKGVAAPRQLTHLRAALEDLRVVGVPKDSDVQDAYFQCKRCLVDAIALFEAEVGSPGKYSFHTIGHKLSSKCDEASADMEGSAKVYLALVALRAGLSEPD